MFGKERIKEQWKYRIYEVIFESDTSAGKLFDVLLLILIALSVIVVIMDSMAGVAHKYHDVLWTIEWIITIIFTIEYIFRLISVGRPLLYARSFYGIVDVLSFLPTYFTLLAIEGAPFFAVIRILRLLRVFRIFKLHHFVSQMEVLMKALWASATKIFIFFSTVLSFVIILAALMYLIEGPENGFTSIPMAMYWAIVTLTTVGYGDIIPQTGLGRIIASFIMVLGYSIIAVPTGIISVELSRSEKPDDIKICNNCNAIKHHDNAEYCYNCGAKLPVNK